MSISVKKKARILRCSVEKMLAGWSFLETDAADKRSEGGNGDNVWVESKRKKQKKKEKIPSKPREITPQNVANGPRAHSDLSSK